MVELIEKEMLHEFTEVMSYHTLQSLKGQPLPLLIDIFSFLKENATINGLKESPEQIAKLTEEMILHGVEAIR